MNITSISFIVGGKPIGQRKRREEKKKGMKKRGSERGRRRGLQFLSRVKTDERTDGQTKFLYESREKRLKH